MSLIGQSAFLNDMYDCTGALQVPTPKLKDTTYPGSYGSDDVEVSCPTQPFPALATDGGNSVHHLSLCITADFYFLFTAGVAPVIVEEVEGPEGDDTT